MKTISNRRRNVATVCAFHYAEVMAFKDVKVNSGVFWEGKINIDSLLLQNEHGFKFNSLLWREIFFVIPSSLTEQTRRVKLFDLKSFWRRHLFVVFGEWLITLKDPGWCLMGRFEFSLSLCIRNFTFCKYVKIYLIAWVDEVF